MSVSEIREETLPPVRVLTREQRVRAARLPATIEALIVAMEAEADALRLEVTGGGFVRYLGKVGEADDGPIQVCLPVSAEGHVMPEVRVLTIKGEGADAQFPGVLALYDQLAAHMAAHGLTADGPPRESYEGGRIVVAWPVRPA